MRFVKAKNFTATTAWDALDISSMDDATVRLHWTDKPYKWHTNDGEEVLVVLDGVVDMHYRKDGDEVVQRLEVGDICHVEAGDEHVAHPDGVARILVIERTGSI
ncbi:MAG: cupin [Rhodospirillaceae bacterium]|nr:cupin [Rhodospirillaceae bacterium]MCK5166720.1 cupin [Rhodospirillaceae bacterium]